MARKRKQKKARAFSSTAPAPIVNIANARSARHALQPDRKPQVLLACPTVDGNINYTIGVQMARAMASSEYDECPFKFAVHVEPGKRPIDYARNRIVQLFMKTDADWLIMWDQDQAIPENFYEMCMVTDADVVSALVPVWVGNMDPEAMFRINAYGVNDKGQCFNLPMPPDDVNLPYRVPITGTGCIAIRRRVFAPPPHGLGMKAPFYFTYMDDRKVQGGEDINFGVNANKAGFVLAVHPSVRVDHVKPVPLWQVDAWHRAASAMEAEGRQTTDEQRLSIG